MSDLTDPRFETKTFRSRDGAALHFSIILMVGVVQAGVPVFVEHWGDNLQFYPNFALFSTLGGMNLDHDFFSGK